MKGYRNNCLKACSHVSKWTYLCEIKSLNLINSMRAHATGEASLALRNEYLNKLEQTLSQKLCLAHRDKRSAKDRAAQLESANTHKRYLEDYFMTISDMIVFFFLTQLLNEHVDLKQELENKYSHICAWYQLMLDDAKFSQAYAKNSAIISLVSTDCLPAKDSFQFSEM